MPNWCYNEAVLVAPSKEALDTLVASLETEVNEKFFNHLRPRPESEKDNWYDWNVENWGTKWDTEPHSFERSDDTLITLVFDTAWSPPLALYCYLEDNGWTVRAKYNEPGIGFVGRFEDNCEEDWEYDFEDESTINAIPEDLCEWAGIYEDYNYWKELNDEDVAE